MTTSVDLHTRMAAYATELRRQGAIRSDAVERAFSTVPRHRFLHGGFYYRAQHHTLTRGELPSQELLDVIYANNGLFTHTGRDGDPTSSSSGPSLMARMLEALELEPGLRVLEIGGGTGYNAALITTITGAEVTAVEAGRRAADNAQLALADLGLDQRVRIVHGDGYPGDPAGQRYDRIIVTCGIAGIPPGWLDQLTEQGMILAPIAHAGVHPIVALRREQQRLVGRTVMNADFMPAAGALRPQELFAHNPQSPIPAEHVHHQPAATETMSIEQYRALTFYLGTRDHRTTRAYVDHEAFSPAAGATALVEGGTGAWIQQDGTLLRAGEPDTAEALRDRILELVADFDRARPDIVGWRSRFDPADELTDPLLLPAQWIR